MWKSSLRWIYPVFLYFGITLLLKIKGSYSEKTIDIIGWSLLLLFGVAFFLDDLRKKKLANPDYQRKLRIKLMEQELERRKEEAYLNELEDELKD